MEYNLNGISWEIAPPDTLIAYIRANSLRRWWLNSEHGSNWSDLMEKESTNKLASPSMGRTLLIFSIGGFILNYAVNIVYDVCRIIWIDFIHYNPYRSQSDALYLMASSPLVAMLATFYYNIFTVIVGVIIAMVSHRIWGRVPFYSLIIMLPLSVFCMYVETPSGPTPVTYMDFLGLSLLQMPVLVGCWWWSNRIPKS